ncbi:MAG TPA: hypothetical protein ENG87_04440, partial [Candidatus Pacearchaeota archaeon]|nr:hypothetical protein [Candidatus Pacearchaeota archaeon]
MVYKRYIKRRVNGKIKKFGPYYYESYRDKDGIARTRYSSQPKKPTKESAVISKKPSATFFKSTSFALILLVLLFVLTSGGFIFANQSTGNFIINFQETGSIISGFTNSFYTFMTSFVADGSKEEPVSEEPPSEELVGDIVGEAPSQEELTEEQPEEAVGEEITVNETTEEPTNETIEEPIVNETITNETIVNETIINETIEKPVSPGDDSSKDTQRGHENLSRGDSAEPSVEP